MSKTQTEQTIADRIRGMIRANLQGEFYSLETAYPSVDRLSATIAAEIHALTGESGRLTVQYEIANRESALHAKQLAEAIRERVAETKISAELTADVHRLKTALRNADADIVEARAQIAAYERQLAIAVPKAKAWDALELAKQKSNRHYPANSGSDTVEAITAYLEAADRAREVAKGSP